MRVLVTGKGTSGSWQIRGEQLGRAIGATVKPRADGNFDLAVVVKRGRFPNLPVVWDIVDAYPQSRPWKKDEAIAWVRGSIKAQKPIAVIWPNQKMREDCDTGLPGIVLPHHHRPGIEPNPVREVVRVIGYEGSEKYLGKWSGVLQRQCDRRGIRFSINPVSMANLDVVVAFRDGDCYASRHWKSNVKLANAHGSGTPFIGQRECGYLETATGHERWAETESELVEAIDSLVSRETRKQVSDAFKAKAYPIERAAKELKAFLGGL